MNLKRKKKLEEKVEERTTTLLIELGMNPATKAFRFTRKAVCALCFESYFESKSLYDFFAQSEGVNIMIIERWVSYANSRAFQKNEKLYKKILGCKKTRLKRSKRNYEFLKRLSDYVRLELFEEWDSKIQRDIIINEYIFEKGVDVNSRGFYIIKECIHSAMDVGGDLLPLRYLMKDYTAKNLTACSRSITSLKTNSKTFIYESTEFLLKRYPQFACLNEVDEFIRQLGYA